MSQLNNRVQTLKLAQFGILLALEIIVCFTPLGTIPFPGIPATLSHLPVIITAIVLGPAFGALMGFFFGLFSFIVLSFITPSVASLLFTPLYSIGDIHGSWLSLITCFVPRILLGVIAGYAYQFLKKYLSNEKISIALTVSGLVASLAHTILVLGLAYMIIGKGYAAAAGLEYSVLLGAFAGTVLSNGVMEALIAVLAVVLACPPLLSFLKKTT
jgi:uncharacterized membrane protein